MSSQPAQHPMLNRSVGSLSGKAEWLAWCAGLFLSAVVVTCLYVGVGVHAAWADFMAWFIVVLFIAAVIKSYRDIAFLDRETKLASEQVAQLSQVNDLARFLQTAKPSVFRSHIAALHTIFLNHSDISQDSLIEITHARLLARNKLVEMFSSIMVTLGLIGTIIGLLMSVGGLSAILGGDAEKLRSGMQQTIAGLGTAFYTTLAGAIFGGVILRVLVSVVDANIMRYMAHLSELTEVYVLPAMRRMAGRLETGGYYKRLDEPARA